MYKITDKSDNTLTQEALLLICKITVKSDGTKEVLLVLFAN